MNKKKKSAEHPVLVGELWTRDSPIRLVFRSRTMGRERGIPAKTPIGKLRKKKDVKR